MTPLGVCDKHTDDVDHSYNWRETMRRRMLLKQTEAERDKMKKAS